MVLLGLYVCMVIVTVVALNEIGSVHVHCHLSHLLFACRLTQWIVECSSFCPHMPHSTQAAAANVLLAATELKALAITTKLCQSSMHFCHWSHTLLLYKLQCPQVQYHMCEVPYLMYDVLHCGVSCPAGNWKAITTLAETCSV